MVATPLASAADLRVRLAGTEVADGLIDAVLADVSDLARDEAGGVGVAWDVDWTAAVVTVPATTAVPASVRVVVLDAARRRVLNPDAYVSESVGDYTYRRAEGTEGDATFTDAELKTLRGFRSTGTGLGSIRMERPGLYEAAIAYRPTNMEGDPLPWPSVV